jgi:hypothetical protein
MPVNFFLKISQIPFYCSHAPDLYHFLPGDSMSVSISNTARGIKRSSMTAPAGTKWLTPSR